MAAERRSRDATKQLMIEAGTEVLLRDGISSGASTFRYADAFALLAEQGIKVTRGSVHERIWASQEAWQLNVISELIERNEAQRREILGEIVNANLPQLPRETPEQRWQVLAECCRVTGLSFIETIDSAPEQRLLPVVIAAWRASSTAIPEHHALGERLANLQRFASSRVQRQITALVTILELEVNPIRPLQIDEAIRAYAVTATAMGYSQTIRIAHDRSLLETFDARCPDGEFRPWNSLGMANWLIAKGLFTVKGLAQS